MGIIKDGWDISKEVLKPVFTGHLTKHANKKRNREILLSFSKEFASHDKKETTSLDYFSWIEEHNEWQTGSGRLLTTSHKEITRLWSQYKKIAPYEALLVRYIGNGGNISRLFALGAEYLDPTVRLLLLEVMYRHHLLGFSPKVTSVIDLHNSTKNLDVSCEMFASFNDQAAYYLRLPDNSDPLFVRTTNKKYISSAISCHFQLLESSESFEKWYKNQVVKLSKKQIKDVEEQCNLILEISKEHKNA
ncbi:MAG: hypothetical protein VST71_07125 [Nitrospirota bacterium]|nr:hypothetical protein [Nitrospirota bacterium]